MSGAGRADPAIVASWRARTPAGGYARDRHQRGLRSWRGAIRKYVLLLFGPFIVVGVAGGVVAADGWAWAAGASFGLGVGAWMVLRESPPAYIENWQTGAEGEQKTARALRSLGNGWLVVHDVDSGYGNYDHVLIGPAGVFLLDSKNPVADAHIRDGELWLRRRHDTDADWPERRPRRDAFAGAARLHDQLAGLAGACPWVNAVTVLWCPFPAGIHEADRYTIAHGTQLVAWLEALPVTLSSEAARTLADAARRLAPGA